MKRSKMGSEGIGSGGKYRSEAIRRLPKPTYEAEAHTKYKYCPYCGAIMKESDMGRYDPYTDTFIKERGREK